MNRSSDCKRQVARMLQWRVGCRMVLELELKLKLLGCVRQVGHCCSGDAIKRRLEALRLLGSSMKRW